MLLRTLLSASLLGGILPLASQAQITPDASRFYVGVRANMLSNVPFKDRGLVPQLVGPALTAGMQFTPRLAGQVGLSYHWGKETRDLLYRFGNITVTSRSKYFSIPVLLRYTVTEPAQRFHFDILGGATLLHTTGSTSYTNSTGVLDPGFRDNSGSNTNFCLTLGPAVRAAISSHLELTASSAVSAVVGDNYYKFSDRLFLNTSLGVNYTFGQR
jgi:hypothetical protein